MNGLFEVEKVPFSYQGSWMSIAIPPGKKELFFRNHHMRPNQIFSIRTIVDGQVVSPTIEARPASLLLSAGAGQVEICFDGPDTIRMRGRDLCLQFTGKPIHAYNDGPGLVVLNVRNAFRRYEVEALSGKLDLRGAYVSEEEDLENLAAHQGGGDFSILDEADQGQPKLYITPGADGNWEIAIDEFWSTWQRPVRTPDFEGCLAAAEENFNEFKDSMPPAPEQLTEARILAAYINWSCTVNPAGLIKRPTLFMSKNWMNNVWSWDQCFNAMALAAGQPELAMDQMLTLVDHQDEFGAYTDAFNDMEMHYNYSKPPVHGLTFKELLRRLPERPSPAVMETMYVSLGKQANWWMTYRCMGAKDNGQGGLGAANAQGLDSLPYYLHGNDSGWDNSTMFAKGVPLAAPDLAALLTIQMDVLAELAGDLGKPDEAEHWQTRAAALFNSMMAELWRGDHFVARLAHDGALVESKSLIPWLPIILGQRLPTHIRAMLKDGIEGHLTDWGLATERLDSPNYIADGYWRGPIWAPSTFLAVMGLERAGYSDLADIVAERFCRLCAKSGFAENFNAVTGEPLRDPAYTWTASVFLLLAERAGKDMA